MFNYTYCLVYGQLVPMGKPILAQYLASVKQPCNIYHCNGCNNCLYYTFKSNYFARQAFYLALGTYKASIRQAYANYLAILGQGIIKQYKTVNRQALVAIAAKVSVTLAVLPAYRGVNGYV